MKGIGPFCLSCWFMMVAFQPLASEQTPAAIPFYVGVVNLPSEHMHQKLLALLGVLLQGTGYKPELREMPGRRIMVDLNQGNLDADMARKIDLSKGFANILLVDEPLIFSCTVMLQLTDSEKRREASESLQVGILSGAPASQVRIAEEWPAATAVEFKTIEQAINLLLYRRVNFLMVPNIFVEALQQRSPESLEVYKVEPPYPMRMHVNILHRDLVPLLVQRIREQRAELQKWDCDPAGYSPVIPF